MTDLDLIDKYHEFLHLERLAKQKELEAWGNWKSREDESRKIHYNPDHPERFIMSYLVNMLYRDKNIRISSILDNTFYFGPGTMRFRWNQILVCKLMLPWGTGGTIPRAPDDTRLDYIYDPITVEQILCAAQERDVTSMHKALAQVDPIDNYFDYYENLQGGKVAFIVENYILNNLRVKLKRNRKISVFLDKEPLFDVNSGSYRAYNPTILFRTHKHHYHRLLETFDISNFEWIYR